MTDNDDDLSRVDLHAWRVPPARALDHGTLLARAIAPATTPPRMRIAWVVGALALANAALVAILIVVLTQREPQTATITFAPAGGPVDPSAREALRRLEQERRDALRVQREAAQKLAEIRQLTETIEDLNARIAKCEKTGPRPAPTPPRDPSDTPRAEHIDREMITTAMSALSDRIARCGAQATARLELRAKVRVAPDGGVQSVTVGDRPPAQPTVAACVVRAVKKARFSPTKNGGSFTYPFVIRPDDGE